ncbi:MAG: efflux RND transporter periplasmic adaptor subunit [Alcanivoracaceae bacterium]
MVETGLPARSKGLWWIAACTALVLAGLYSWSPKAERTEIIDSGLLVDVIQVRYSSGALPIELEGIAQAADQIALVAEVSGVVVERPEWFRNGGQVDQGALLLAIDDQPYRLALAERRSQVSAAALHLADVRAKASVARRVNGDKATPYARLVPHLEEAEARLAAAEASLKRAEMELARTRLQAPFAGRVRDVTVSPGQFIHSGERLATLYSTDRIEVRLPLRDEWLALMELPLGSDATVAPIPVILRGRFAGRDAQWQGQIVRREGGLNRNRMIYLVARVDDADQGEVPLEPGVLVTVEVAGRQLDRVARLPASVLAGRQSVWVVDADNRLRQRTVEVIHQSRRDVWVGQGLQDGDRIAASGALRWLEGALVQPRDATPVAMSLRSASR